ncbi:MAG: hypothetical protein KBS35_00185 [Mycoplasma sp.]|nr:hypothetical protein [Candidatus Hennigella equi]
MTQTTSKQKIKSPRLAYMGYLFQTFLKRPFGYVIALLFVIYLAIILLIVPASLHLEPLFIWNIGGFNMPIFNLFFIAGAAASIAVAVFRTGRDDGTDLNLSAKPLTKRTTVWIKTIVYLLIMLATSLITLFIVALVMPVFGKYDESTNITGIEPQKYIGLILSVLVGNLINMLFFGGISVFISMIGGQVITIIGTVAIVFVMCIMNFLFPRVIKTSTDILSDKYDTEILGYSCNTLRQYRNSDEDATPLNFAAMQCIVNDLGIEENHYDTKEYWEKAEMESGRKIANYFDFGEQLSNLYSAFGLDNSKLKEASKLVIGTNNSYNYHIDEETHLALPETIENGNYPISIYGMTQALGKEYPIVYMVGADMTLAKTNWYLLSTLWQIEYNSINYASLTEDSVNIPNDPIWKTYKKPWNKLAELRTNYYDEAVILYNKALDVYTDNFAKTAYQTISTADYGPEHILPKPWDELTSPEKFKAISTVHLAWAINAQVTQIEEIGASGETFPFKSTTVKKWFNNLDDQGKDRQEFREEIYQKGIGIEPISDEEEGYLAYSRLVTAKFGYAETLSNMYQYTVTNFYNLANIIAIWSVISCTLFAGAIIVYQRTDFK